MLVIASLSRSDVSGAYSSGPTGGFTGLTGTGSSFARAYQVVSSASGSYQTSWVYTSSVVYDIDVAVFKAIPAVSSTKPLSALGVGDF